MIDTADQERFAQLSGDHNPLHVDPLRARRSVFGAPVVHGVHLVLRALDHASTAVSPASPQRLVRLAVEFRRHVPVDAPFTIDVRTAPTVPMGRDPHGPVGHEWIGEIRRGSMRCVRLRWQTEPADADRSTILREMDPIRPAATGSTPCEGEEPLSCDQGALDSLLPGLRAWLEETDVAALLATTRVVGMRCPGERALLRRIHFERDDEPDSPDGALRLRVVRRDPRMSLTVLELRGAHRRLDVEAIERPVPVAQAPMAAVREMVGKGRFSAARVAVIGGSRGLGEVAIRLLCAGGATCLATSRYADSELGALVDALGVTPLILDVTAPDPDALAALRRFAPTHLAYFAAPPLTPIAADDVHGGSALTAVLEHGLQAVLAQVLSDGALTGVLVPSTTHIDAAPEGLEQYAAIKQRIERSMTALQRTRPDLRIRVPRLPPLLTDQTVGNVAEGRGHTLEVLLATLEQWIPDRRLRLMPPQEHHDDGLRTLAARTLGRDPYQASRAHLHWLWRCAPEGAGRDDSSIAVREDQVVGMAHRLRLPWRTADGSTVRLPAIIDLAVDPDEPPSTALALLRGAMRSEESVYIPASRGLGPGLARMGAVEVPSSWWRRPLLPAPRGSRWQGGGRDPMRLRDLVDGLHGTDRHGLQVTTRASPTQLSELADRLAAETAIVFTPELVAWRLFHRYGPPSAWLHQEGSDDTARADLIVAFAVRRHVPFVRLITALGTPAALITAVSSLVRVAAGWGAAALLATVPPDLGPVMRSCGLRRIKDAPSAWLIGSEKLPSPVRYDGILGDLGLDGIPRDSRIHRGAPS